MNDYYFEIEYSLPNNTIHAVHKIHHKYYSKNWYRMSLSRDGFNNFCMRRFLRYNKDGNCFIDTKKYKNHLKQFSQKHIPDYQLEMSMVTKQEKLLRYSWINPNIPIFEHKSVYDFYSFIGYDKKSKKFTKPEPTPIIVLWESLV